MANRQVLKYPLIDGLDGGVHLVDHMHTKVIRLPITSIPLHVAQQRTNICVWVEVTDHHVLRDFTFVFVGTGAGLIPPTYTYLGTVQASDGYVWHIYWERESKFTDATPLIDTVR